MMKKVGIIKRVLCISLVFLLNINALAAVVSDNDGSAFITKAEFDSLKNNFQSQIDSYNQSIDSKIDGAIASYLSGIKLSTTESFNFLYERSGSETEKFEAVNKGTLKRSTYWQQPHSLALTRFSGNSGTSFTKGGYPGSGISGWMSFTVNNKASSVGNRIFVCSATGANTVEHIYNNGGILLTGAYTDAQTWNDGNGDFWAKLTQFDDKYVNTLYEGPLESAGGNKDGDASMTDTPDTSTSGYPAIPACLGGFTYFTKQELDEDNNLYFFATCDEPDIMAYKSSETQVTHYEDSSYSDANGLKKYLGMRLGSTNALISGSDSQTRSARCYYLAKMRIKTSITDTNLKNFKNGKLPYPDMTGTIKYPYFYGGLPLFCFNNDSATITFTIRVDKTITSSVNNKIRLWFNYGEFSNSTSVSSSTIIKNGTLDYFDIDAGTSADITLQNVDANKVVFLRWSQQNTSGTPLYYGGNLKILTNGTRTFAN